MTTVMHEDQSNACIHKRGKLSNSGARFGSISHKYHSNYIRR